MPAAKVSTVLIIEWCAIAQLADRITLLFLNPFCDVLLGSQQLQLFLVVFFGFRVVFVRVRLLSRKTFLTDPLLLIFG
jgi:hypothetical protein